MRIEGAGDFFQHLDVLEHRIRGRHHAQPARQIGADLHVFARDAAPGRGVEDGQRQLDVQRLGPCRIGKRAQRLQRQERVAERTKRHQPAGGDLATILRGDHRLPLPRVNRQQPVRRPRDPGGAESRFEPCALVIAKCCLQQRLLVDLAIERQQAAVARGGKPEELECGGRFRRIALEVVPPPAEPALVGGRLRMAVEQGLQLGIRQRREFGALVDCRAP